MVAEAKIMDKIKKLLAKTTNNPSQAEVEQAMLLAQKLMVQHGLTMGDITTEDKPKPKEVADAQISFSKRIPWWHKSLANIIAQNFRCTTYYRGGVGLYFIGLKDDFELAKSLFDYAIGAIDYQSKLYAKSHTGMGGAVGLKNDYIRGFLAGLQSKFKEQVAKENWGLVLVKDHAVIQAEQKHNFRKGAPTSHSSAGSQDAYSKGYTDGNSFTGAKGNLQKGR